MKQNLDSWEWLKSQFYANVKTESEESKMEIGGESVLPVRY